MKPMTFFLTLSLKPSPESLEELGSFECELPVLPDGQLPEPYILRHNPGFAGGLPVHQGQA